MIDNDKTQDAINVLLSTPTPPSAEQKSVRGWSISEGGADIIEFTHKSGAKISVLDRKPEDTWFFDEESSNLNRFLVFADHSQKDLYFTGAKQPDSSPSADPKPLGLGTPVYAPELKLFTAEQPSADPIRVVEWKNDSIQFEVNDQKTAAALNRLNDKLHELAEENTRLKAERPDSAAASDPVPASVYKEEVEGLRLVIQTIADELGCGDEPRCKWIMQEIAELKEKATKPKRITEQELRDIIEAYANNYAELSELGNRRKETWLAGEGRTLLAKLNEHREPDYKAQIEKLEAENERLNSIINSPQKDDFIRAVSTEAEHQRQRWGSDHDGGKTPADWFWLIGYLAGKALHAHSAGNVGKTEHHIITTAAACANWHRALFGKTNMRPGIDPAIAKASASTDSGVE